MLFEPITIPERKQIPASPRALGVPHDTWMSQGQREGYGIIRDLYEQSELSRKFVVLEGPTGTGKTVWAAAAAHHDMVTYLAHTHGLLDQAEHKYGFSPLKGKHVYDCVLPAKNDEWRSLGMRQSPTAYDCTLGNMRDCTVAHDCPYLHALDFAASAHKVACTPQMAIFNRTIREREGILVIDECHALVESILGFVDIQITQKEIDDFGFPPYPFQDGVGDYSRYTERRDGMEMTPDMTNEFYTWLSECREIAQDLQRGDNISPAASRAHREFKKLDRLINVLYASDWFVKTGKGIIEAYNPSARRHEKMGGVMLKPLSAASFASTLWESKRLVILMSATVGDPAPLMQQIGVTNYEYHSFSHPVPVEARRVFDLGAKRMTHENITKDPNIYRMQAARIAGFIDTLPQHYRGIVLTSSYTKIKELNKYLPLSLRDPSRIWTPPAASIGNRVDAFINDPRPGLIWIETIQGAGEGFDGRGELLRFVVVAGLNHPNPTDAYVRARKRVASVYMTAQVFNQVMQACGRASRSEHRDRMTKEELAAFDDSEFTEDGYLIAYTALADGSALTKQGLRNYSPWFREAITPIMLT